MDIDAVEHLQREVERAMSGCDCGAVERIELDKGSEVMDLTINAALRVHTRDGKMRGFSVVARSFFDWVFTLAPLEANTRERGQEHVQVYTTGGPLVVVFEITGTTIVHGVLRYVKMEESRAGF